MMRRTWLAVVPAITVVLAGCGGDDSGDPGTSAGDASPYAGSYSIMNETTGTEVAVTVEGGVRAIVANGLPDHETGEFPNAGNPNSISAQDYSYEFPANPVLDGEVPADVGGGALPEVDLDAAAQQLGVTVDELVGALGTDVPPDLAATAAALGITEDDLQSALGVSPGP